MRKSETLRGRGAFEQLFAAGRRANGTLLRCLYRFEPGAEGRVLVGFAVPRRMGSAVRRNRIRRLMREAYRLEHENFRQGLAQAGMSVSMILVFRGSPGVAAERLGLEPVRRDVVQLCRSLLASACKVS